MAKGVKTTNEKIVEIITSYSLTNSYNATAKEVGVSEGTVRNVIKKQRTENNEEFFEENPDIKLSKDIFISRDKNKLNALDGDIVLVKLLSKVFSEGKSLEGEIVKIVKHENDAVVGIFQKNQNFGFVVPDNKNFGTDIFISKKDFKGAKNDQKVVVKIIKYIKHKTGQNIKLLTRTLNNH